MHIHHTRRVWRQYNILLGPMKLMSGMWDGQSELCYNKKLLCSFCGVDSIHMLLRESGHLCALHLVPHKTIIDFYLYLVANNFA